MALPSILGFSDDGDLEVVYDFTPLGERYAELSDYATNPAAWIESNGEFMWSKQREILESVRDNRYTAVHSAHDMGKSFIASRTIAWWIACHPVGDAFVVSTAPTAAQVAAIMWREVAKIHKKAELIGKINRAGYPQWYIDGELVGYGRKPADYEQSAFQGIHAKYVLIVIDEACGVAKHLYDSVDALATNDHARVLAIGNPDDPASHFASVCKIDSGWNVIHLDGLRSPNMTRERIVGPDPANPKFPLLAALMQAEGIPYSTEEVPDYVRDLLVTERWIEERIERWVGIPKMQAEALPPVKLGELVQGKAQQSALFTAKVRGEFPTSISEGIIPIGWVQRAVERWHDLMDSKDTREHSLQAAQPGGLVVGVDVARGGNDESVLTIRYGSLVVEQIHLRIPDTIELAEKIAPYLMEPGSVACIDVIGLGSGTYDYLRKMKNDGLIVGQVVPFNSSARTGRQDKLGQFQFRNDRAAGWWNMREQLDPAFGSKLAIPDDDNLIEELAAVKFDHFVGGIMAVESKDDIKRRIGRSTDSADSLIYAFWINGPSGAEFIPYADETYDKATRGRPRRGAVYNFEGYDPFTDEDTSISPSGTSMVGYDGPGYGRPGWAGYDDSEWR